MQFLFLHEAIDNDLLLKDEDFKYIIKVRREKIGSLLHVRNLKDDYLYTYIISEIDKKTAFLTYERREFLPKKGRDFKLIWAVIDTKIIEKTLPHLNEIGVGSIDFVYTKFSQKNYKIDLERMRRILIGSNQQCGRSDLMKIRIFDDLKMFMAFHEDFYVLDFTGEKIKENKNIKAIFVGCEGGFSEEERKLLSRKKTLSFDCNFILKSQTAACAIASKILL